MEKIFLQVFVPVRECGGDDATLAARFILAEAETPMGNKNAIPLIPCTVGSHASHPRSDQEQKHGGLAIVKAGVVPTPLTIKPFVIGRKNWLFANTEAGAYASALLYSLVETARINGLNPYDYLLGLLTALKSRDADIDWERLLPWNITLP